MRRQPMCGIVGYVGPKQVEEILIQGLKRLRRRNDDDEAPSLAP